MMKSSSTSIPTVQERGTNPAYQYLSHQKKKVIRYSCLFYPLTLEDPSRQIITPSQEVTKQAENLFYDPSRTPTLPCFLFLDPECLIRLRQVNRQHGAPPPPAPTQVPDVPQMGREGFAEAGTGTGRVVFCYRRGDRGLGLGA